VRCTFWFTLCRSDCTQRSSFCFVLGCVWLVLWWSWWSEQPHALTMSQKKVDVRTLLQANWVGYVVHWVVVGDDVVSRVTQRRPDPVAESTTRLALCNLGWIATEELHLPRAIGVPSWRALCKGPRLLELERGFIHARCASRMGGYPALRRAEPRCAVGTRNHQEL
jgi:hypothetical protein